MTSGRCADIRWDVQGEVTRVVLTRNGNVMWDAAPARGSLEDCPAFGRMTYQIEARGPGGTVRRSVELAIHASSNSEGGRPDER
jgi:hypothetical protein